MIKTKKIKFDDEGCPHQDIYLDGRPHCIYYIDGDDEPSVELNGYYSLSQIEKLARIIDKFDDIVQRKMELDVQKKEARTGR